MGSPGQGSRLMVTGKLVPHLIGQSSSSVLWGKRFLRFAAEISWACGHGKMLVEEG